MSREEEEREHLQRLIELHRANLRHYEEQEAKYGLDCPVYIKNAKEEARQGLAEARAKLATLEGRVPGAEPSIPAIPQNLPPRGEFIGREREMERVRQALASRSYLVVIEGIGGIGKTALALEVAHELWEKGLYEAVVWTTARNRALDLNDVLDTFARTVDYPYIAQLPPEEKPTEAAKLMRAKKCLLLVDNFETIKDEAVPGFLLNLPEPSKALITTRHHALGEARTIPLKGMEQGEALMLLQLEGERRSVEAIAQAEEKTLLRLYEATGGAPLALKWAVGQLKFGQTLDTVLDGLYKAKGRIFEHMFGRSWEMLSEDGRRILMVMPIFATSASKEAIEAASDVHTWDLDEGLGQLVEMSLVEVSGGLEEQQRYSVHPLVRAFAGAELDKEKELEKEAWLQVASYFLDFVEQHSGEDQHSHNMLEVERSNITGVLDWSIRVEAWGITKDLWTHVGYFFWLRGYWSERDKYLQFAIKACEMKNDWSAYARLTTYSGWDLMARGHYEEAEKRTLEAIRVYEELEDRKGAIMATRNLGVIKLREGNLRVAEELLQRSYNMVQEIDDWSVIVRITKHSADLALAKANYREAHELYERALAVNKQHGDLVGVGVCLRGLGNSAHKLGNFEKARNFFKKSLASFNKIGMVEEIARSKQGLAMLEEKTGDRKEALGFAKEALDAYERLGLRKEIEETQSLIEHLERVLAEQGHGGLDRGGAEGSTTDEET
ncbi:MAG: tetratricopeptide repeat protein [Anaerolineales bacterium]|nr:MAG: tetratricopeptide repeat protein [Anaerolineales bacterium]